MSLVVRPAFAGDKNSEVPLEMSDTTSVREFRQAVEDATASVCDSTFDLYIGRLIDEGHASLGLVFGVDYHTYSLQSAHTFDRKETQRQIKENDEIMEKTLSEVGVRNHDVIAMVVRPDTLPALISSSSEEDSPPEGAIDDTDSDSSTDDDWGILIGNNRILQGLVQVD